MYYTVYEYNLLPIIDIDVQSHVTTDPSLYFYCFSLFFQSVESSASTNQVRSEVALSEHLTVDLDLKLSTG